MESGPVRSSQRHLFFFKGDCQPHGLARAVGRLWMLLALLLFSFSAGPLQAGEAPTLEHLHPLGVLRGSTNAVTVAGKFDPWPPKVWVDMPGVVFNAETNKGKMLVEVSREAKPGPVLVRLYNESGASEPRILMIADRSEIMETEPNDHFAKAQAIAQLPATINGRFERRGDADSFQIHLRRGEWLDARIDSYSFMSKLDSVLRLTTTNGYQLAWNHDFITLDPRLTWRAPDDQTVVVQVYGFPYPAEADVRLAGGEGCVYRLHLAVSDSMPADNAESVDVGRAFDEPAARERFGRTLLLADGIIEDGTDEDWFPASVAQGQWYEAEVQAAVLGSPLDAWLKVRDASGKELTRSDDEEGSRDPLLTWKAPSSGEFAFGVGHLLRQGGDQFRYRISVREIGPELKAFVAASSMALMPGATNELKLNIKRLRGFTNEITVSVRGLPSGITVSPTPLPDKDGEVSLKMAATSEAAPFQGPVQVTLSEPGGKELRTVPFELISRSVNNGVPGGYSSLLIEKTDQIWLTVQPKPPEPQQAATNKVAGNQ